MVEEINLNKDKQNKIMNLDENMVYNSNSNANSNTNFSEIQRPYYLPFRNRESSQSDSNSLPSIEKKERQYEENTGMRYNSLEVPLYKNMNKIANIKLLIIFLTFRKIIKKVLALYLIFVIP